MTIQKVLTIAGSDTSGGAGAQADLKTFQEYGVYGMSVLTSIVSMNPAKNWHHEVFLVPHEMIQWQLATMESVQTIASLKTGMLGTNETIETVGAFIQNNQIPFYVMDPVMVCKGENEVMDPESVVKMKEILLPLATITTPNLFEASQLADMPPLRSIEEMQEAAKKIVALGVPAVVIKGGTRLAGNEAVDVFYDGTHFENLRTEKIDTTYNHGAGCTMAAAITAGLAQGLSVLDAVIKAKAFVAAGIQAGFPLNQFVGPVWHGAYHEAENRA
ncbi:bifunctional hydroxymethylpyrimidine kinase/phosphomethylpyrimidine kinase [Isobaculum melis]|uniref:pyridoxal kinase n=1 Tax=Isobaculum melis TaxID=142588 RepID=A0A1H9U0U0_9LACT|nr:bifunctional hydroxymethylpyrimidine kinase/phosphomethylpyrimidine kinase [Isobaculum melis]SES02888.1 pyridoxine kinase [Isobaculum melis]